MNLYGQCHKINKNWSMHSSFLCITIIHIKNMLDNIREIHRLTNNLHESKRQYLNSTIFHYNPTLKDNASMRSQNDPSAGSLLYHNLTVTSSSKELSTSQQDANSSKDIPSAVRETEEMLLNSASVSKSSGSFVRNCAAEMKSMSFNSSW